MTVWKRWDLGWWLGCRCWPALRRLTFSYLALPRLPSLVLRSGVDNFPKPSCERHVKSVSVWLRFSWFGDVVLELQFYVLLQSQFQPCLPNVLLVLVFCFSFLNFMFGVSQLPCYSETLRVRLVNPLPCSFSCSIF